MKTRNISLFHAHNVFTAWSLHGDEKNGGMGANIVTENKGEKGSETTHVHTKCHVLNQGNGANIQHTSSWKAHTFVLFM